MSGAVTHGVPPRIAKKGYKILGFAMVRLVAPGSVEAIYDASDDNEVSLEVLAQDLEQPSKIW